MCSEEDKSNASYQPFFFFVFLSESISFTQKVKKVSTQTWGRVSGGGNVLLSIRKHVGAKGCLQKYPVPRMGCVT